MIKTIYVQLQRFTFELCILFGICPYMPAFFQNKFGGDVAVMYTWILAITGILVFIPCFLWAQGKYHTPYVDKPGYMMALTFASLLAILIGVSALLALYGVTSTFFYLLWREVPSTIITAIMIIGVGLEKLRPKKVAE